MPHSIKDAVALQGNGCENMICPHFPRAMRGGSRRHLQDNLMREDAHSRSKMRYTRNMRALNTCTTRACTKNRTCLTSIRRDIVSKKARLQNSAGENTERVTIYTLSARAGCML
mmetsp:Transcript_85587/g.138768  ORF Transcript_85587/g.138768 Transcript_85587/m.138768 type:complete len:114 (+) Transcript_85587:691-1032(+)